MYRYKVIQQTGIEELQISLTLNPDSPEHLLTVISGLFYTFPAEATFTKPVVVYQGTKPVMEDQVAETMQRLKTILPQLEKKK
jgi:hypothetical protein